MSTDKDWEKWGSSDPYFGVLSADQFRGRTLGAKQMDEFFATGQAHVDGIMRLIHRHFDAEFRPGRSLDFGCGVGRILVPLAGCSGSAVGVDISPSMRAEAEKNCMERGIGNVSLVGSDDDVAQAEGEFDLVHSHIVFAHIPFKRGRRIISALAGKVSGGGYLAIQILSACNAPAAKRGLVRLAYRVPLANIARNIVRGRPALEPPMQLHDYHLPSILMDLSSAGFASSLVVPDRFPSGDFDSAMILARRERSP